MILLNILGCIYGTMNMHVLYRVGLKNVVKLFPPELVALKSASCCVV